MEINSVYSVLQKQLAYIDPNTGGMLFQVLAVFFAFFSGILLFFSRQIKVISTRIFRSIREIFHKDA